ncbi:MAG: endonuclease NucS [Candidatus Daviesbacteria bacterium]|nr:endonuclease NucS [Candidatus Daviesbacteria bacterium]
MKNYYRIMLGRKSLYAEEAHTGNFVGADFGLDMDLSNKLPENWRDFNKEFIPIFLEKHLDKTKVAAGLACGMLWTICKGLQINDIVLCPNNKGSYFVGELTTNYSYHKGEILPHRRDVRWFPKTIERSQMSQPLQNSAGSIGTVSNITQYAEEIENFIAGDRPPTIISTDESVEDPSTFALEMHLEDFLVQNWEHTELGKKYNIFEEEGELVGQQYPSDTGPIDILAISKDKKELLVVELKKGRASDAVIGQIQRYMGYVKEELAEKGQTVQGVIIALEDDIRMRRALAVTQSIDFFTYKVSFKLIKG